MYLHQYDYLLALGLLFAGLDAFNIGANDVANSFATSVSSKSLTFKQAMAIAAVAEFLGALLLGSRVSDTIRNKIISVNDFKQDPAMLMLAMVCALIGSSTWLTIATKSGWPVSTTHSIVGAVIGVGVAGRGAGGVQWGWGGVASIIASWFIAPAIAGGFASIAFLISKYAVLERKNSLRNGMILVPFWFAVTTGVLTMVIVWKGSPALKLDDLPDGIIAASVLGVAGVAVLFCLVFFLPFVRRRLIADDWTLRWWHLAYGPFQHLRGPVPPMPENRKTVLITDYSHRVFGPDETPETAVVSTDDVEKSSVTKDRVGEISVDNSRTPSETAVPHSNLEQTERKSLGPWWYPQNMARKVWYVLTYGMNVDIIAAQNGGKHAAKAKEMHELVAVYDNKTEHLYSFLQVLTATTMSFAHGANDVSNAIGPLATIYLVWSTNTIASKAPVPVWVLAFGGAMISVGLLTFGYKIMSVLGNRLTPHSPSRGFSMELGAAMTVILASQLALPVSSTQSITGATCAVGLCSGKPQALNWKLLGWFAFGWMLTLPVTGVISGCIYGIIINAPRFGYAL